jgi:threonine/homoserine/homoserine lactone efflux protein
MSIQIDWQSLLVVAIVSIVSTVIFVALLSAGIRYVSLAVVRANQRQSPVAARVAGVSFLGLAALLVLFGLYLIVPFFH